MQLQQQRDRIETLNLSVLAVTFEKLAPAQLYVRDTQWPWPMLVDEERTLYSAYDMKRGGWWKIFGFGSWGTYVGLLLRGRKLRRPTDDVRQLGGDVLIDPEGIIRLHYVSKKPADRPSIDSLLEPVEA